MKCINFNVGLRYLGQIATTGRGRSGMPRHKTIVASSAAPSLQPCFTRAQSSTAVPVTVEKVDFAHPDPGLSQAHHVGSPRAGFTNPWPSAKKLKLFAALHTRFGQHPEKNFVPVPKSLDGKRSVDLVKVQTPTWALHRNDCLRATWLGHASFLIELPAAPGASRGIRVLLDPVFSERTSPVNWAGPKRYTPTPCTVDELPDVDIICISHNHYDHLDQRTVTQLYTKRKGAIHVFAPLGNKTWFQQHVGCAPTDATEADWWDSFSVTIPALGEMRITCTPAQHGSGRSVFDQNHTLWCGWALSANGKALYFAGDTAYQAQGTPSPCPAFRQIGETLGPFDLALLPIGLCTPQSFLGSVHATPEQSLEIHRQVAAKVSLGMHYGTVRGSISAHYEDVRDPPRRWRVAAERAGLWCGGGVEGGGQPVDTTREGVGLCDTGETVAV
nr:n-acyl-phosphatidylethanolamine-hydrolyzing phospholipase d [Quercus suber]